MAAAVLMPRQASAACGGTPTYGSATLKLTVPVTGTYTLWTHMNVPNTTNNSYTLEVDGNTCYTVGDGGLSANTWTWVNYKNGSTSSKITQNLTAGTHTLKAIGREANVKFDRILAVQDQNCKPTGTGENCMVSADTTKPALNITAPGNATTVKGTVSVKATATDTSGVSRVEFYVQNVLKQTDTTSPYEYKWDTKTVKDGTYVLTVKAYDAAGNVTNDTRSVTVKNTIVSLPAAPTSIAAKATSPSSVTVSWKAPTGATGFKYRILRNNVALATVTGTSYTDKTVAANTKYDYHVLSVDSLGQTSVKPSSPKSVTTPKPVVKDTTRPTRPTNLRLFVASATQINLTWNKSTDASGIKAYDIYRSGGGRSMSKLVSTTATSFGNVRLKPNTSYTYYVVARDSSGNISYQSNRSTVRTKMVSKATIKTGTLKGTIKSTSGRPLASADVTVWVKGKRYRATANWRGQYVISRVPAGRYEMSVTHRSHSKRTYDVWINAGKVRWQDATLR